MKAIRDLPQLAGPTAGDSLVGTQADGRAGRFRYEGLSTWTAPRPSGVARAVSDKLGDVVHARDAGVLADGTDRSGQLQGLINDLADTGAHIWLSPGTTVAAVQIRNGVHLHGCGPFSVVQSPPGSNLPAIATHSVADFAALVGTDDANGTSPHDWGLYDLTIDGNRATQTATGAARDLATPVQVYGHRYTMQRVTVRNSIGHGFRFEWGQYGEYRMEAHIQDIAWDSVNRRGVWFNGPHDTVIDGCIGVDAGQEADNAYEGVYTGGSGVAHWSKFHAWHRSTSTNRMRVSFSSGGYSIVSNSQFEGGRILFESRAGGGYDQVSISRFYGCYGAAGGTMLDILANNFMLGAGCLFDNGALLADIFAIRLGRAGAPVAGIVIPPETLFYNFASRGPFDLAGEAGLNRLGGVGYNTKTPGRVRADQRSTMDWVGGSPNAYLVQPPFYAGPFADDATAKAAGLRYGEPYLRGGGGTGTVAWVST